MTPSIHDVAITPLKIIADERGAILHMLRSDAPHFQNFGEIYFSMTRPSIVKAWKRHTKITLNIAVPVGRIRLVVYDDRPESPSFEKFDEFFIGPEDQYALVTIPPMLWSGFQNIGTSDALLSNCATIPHDPDEANQKAIDDPSITFDWTTCP